MAVIREATLADEDQVVSLLKNFPPDPHVRDLNWEDARQVFAELLDGSSGKIFVAEEAGAIVGIVSLGFTTVLRFGGRYATIEDFLIDESQRGKGLSRPLLAAARAEAERQGCRELQVNSASDEGFPVYVKNGFEQCGMQLKIWL
ncbi:MAG: GNAT family N-acetyltransferase [Pseudomonadota bacterium]